MTWQVKIKNTRTGGVMFCGVTASTREAAYRTLAYLPGAGSRLMIISLQPIPARNER